VWQAQALALRGAGELQEAQFAADRWGSLDERSLEPLRLRIDLLTERGKHYAAVELAEELVAKTPDDPAAYVRLAQAQRAAGLLSRARDTTQRALVLDPRAWQIHRMAGQVAMSAGRPDEAVAHFRQALRLDPDNGELAVELQRAISTQASKDATAVKKPKRWRRK
jgi:tetratricopeptide (TPR) repeat protein